MKMKLLLAIALGLGILSLESCSTTAVPTAPQIPHAGLALSLAGYGENLDSTYYKVWSDSSYEEFAMDTVMNGVKYTVLLDNTGYQYFYGPKGYSGFWPYGGSLIMFDSALVSMPDTMLEGTAYARATTFASQGVTYTLIEQDVILDTTSVTVPFGSFSNCLVLQSTSTVSGGGQSAGGVTVYYLAKGPSDVYRQFDTGYSIYMIYGVVNDAGWGVAVSKAMPMNRTAATDSFEGGKNELSPLNQYGIDLDSVGPKILKGILR